MASRWHATFKKNLRMSKEGSISLHFPPKCQHHNLRSKIYECICLANFRVLRGREHVQTTTSYELEFQNVLELLVLLSHWQSVHKKYKFLQYHWVSKSIILNVGKSAKQVGYYKIQCVPMHCSIRFTPTSYNNNNRWELKLDRFFLISLI